MMLRHQFSQVKMVCHNFDHNYGARAASCYLHKLGSQRIISDKIKII